MSFQKTRRQGLLAVDFEMVFGPARVVGDLHVSVHADGRMGEHETTHGGRGGPGIMVTLMTYELRAKAFGLSLRAGGTTRRQRRGIGRHHEAGGRAQHRRLIQKESVDRD